jgi:hypothetical protein
MFFYVDDIVFAYRTDRKRAAEAYIDRLKGIFEMRDMGPVKFFLGVRVIQDLRAGTVNLVQDTYIDKLVKDYKINTNSKAPLTPLPIGGIESFDGDVDPNRMHEYRKKVGSVCYPAVISRPDIAKAASKLAEHLVNPGPAHLTAVDHLIKYLYGTKHLTIKFDASGDKGSKHIFEATADAAFANEEGRKSAEEYTFKLFDGLIDWAAKKQATVSTSTTEAELLAMLHAGKEFIWWLNLFKKIGFSPDSNDQMTLYNDNTQTIRLLTSEIPKVDTKLRHVDVAQCWLRECVQRGILKVDYLPTAKMTADGLTKMLPPQKHKEFVKQLGLVDTQKMMDDELRFVGTE